MPGGTTKSPDETMIPNFFGGRLIAEQDEIPEVLNMQFRSDIVANINYCLIVALLRQAR